MRPDRVALVLGEQEADAALARVHVEVVEPEVGEHFLQLPLAVDGAQQLLLAELDDHGVGLLLHGIRRCRRRSDWPRVAAAGGLLLPAIAPRFQQRPLELLGDLAASSAERREAGEPAVHAPSAIRSG